MFVERHLIELRRDRFTPATWVRYVRDALAHARESAIANPAAARSILFVGLVLFFAALAAAGVLALVVDPGLARRAFAWTVVGLVPMIGLTLLHVDLVRDRAGTPLDALGWPSAITLTRVALVPAFLVFAIEGRSRRWRPARPSGGMSGLPTRSTPWPRRSGSPRCRRRSRAA